MIVLKMSPELDVRSGDQAELVVFIRRFFLLTTCPETLS